MRRGRPKSALSISDEECAQLLSMTRARSLPAALTQRARIVLACEREPSNKAVAADLGVGALTVGKWRNGFVTHRLAGLYDELRCGRPRRVLEGVGRRDRPRWGCCVLSHAGDGRPAAGPGQRSPSELHGDKAALRPQRG